MSEIATIKLRLPFLSRLGIFAVLIKKTVGFSFDNLSLFLFREHYKIETNEDLTNFRKDRSSFDIFVIAAYHAAESYQQHRLKKMNFTLQEFALALSRTDEKQLQELTEVWKRSTTYGEAQPPGKKKQTESSSRSAKHTHTP